MSGPGVVVAGQRMSSGAALKVTFVAKCHNQRLTLRPERAETRNTLGQIISEHDPGFAVQFEKHRVTIENPDVIEALRAHKLFNTGFWEEGAAPDEPRPTLAEQTGAITRAGLAGDLDALQEILTLEEETHNRESVLGAARAAQQAVIDARAEAEAKARAAAELATAEVAAAKSHERLVGGETPEPVDLPDPDLPDGFDPVPLDDEPEHRDDYDPVLDAGREAGRRFGAPPDEDLAAEADEIDHEPEPEPEDESEVDGEEPADAD